MLWRTIDKMVEAARRKPELWPEGMPSVDVVTEEVEKAKAAIEKSTYPIVLCHGDFKPSNVVLDKCGKVFFIDHELAGPNYRAFDLMKVFRTAMKSSEPSMQHFLRLYLRQVNGREPKEQELAVIKQETMLFESLTWLEAACFFLALPQFKAQDIPRWHALALDRWEKYESTKQALLEMK
jgi:thiamine kinase-like enzyme